MTYLYRLLLLHFTYVMQCSLLARQMLFCVVKVWFRNTFMSRRDVKVVIKREWGLPDRARPLVMRGHPEEQPVPCCCREEEACVSEEGQSFRDRQKEITMKRDFSFPERTPERENCD